MPLVTDAGGDHSTLSTETAAAHLVVNDEDILLASVDGSLTGGKRRNSSSDEVDSGYSKSSTPTDSAPTTGSVRYSTTTKLAKQLSHFPFPKKNPVGVPVCLREKSASKAMERRIIRLRTGRLATPTPSKF